ncbi:subunit of cleavage factor IA pcf11 domain-containing protein [Trichoderma breve]|uniref:Subunit of cleavage factor IA pcf11 domain-containing protein n=1 Tax=Trichoderma breve TaxID=2034170 RepID=A0A9W9BHZ7_9HYPO|nr:subunit of cleavage factor IA pcf11 domain-containing protein [Trichoderma breve]KAJ4859886.1 subunit of cleavage factor IA pcf11 domain-containing protein [Trichoderma breve]
MSSDGAEVAEDYRLALEDLSSNMRFEISNLTVIARENTEHALAIADVLQQHILKAPPNKKLPALYVMDSIVKNVGTPYTLYFGRSLFKIFMESYAVVDHSIRRKMEEMLKTWKDPVPGSMDTRPVFSHELVRPIENALMKVRAASMPQQGQGGIPGRPRPGMFPHRNTPTPPGMRGFPGPAGNFPPQPHPFSNGGHPGEPIPGNAPHPGQQPAPYPPPSTTGSYNSTPVPFHPAYGSGLPLPSGISVETLNSDIQNLIVAMRAEFSQNPHDGGVQSRLKALLDLQGVVQHSNLPPDQLELIKNKVTELAAVTMRAPLARNSATSTPPIPAPATAPPLALPVHPPSTSMNHIEPPRAAAAPVPNASSLLDQLRAAGMLPPATPPNMPAQIPTPIPPPPPSMFPPGLSASIASLLAAHKPDSGRSSADVLGGSAGLDSAALKLQFRPDAVAALYDDLGPPCTQCGRRFKTDEEGRRKKTAHMDWHFKVHQRSTEAEKRGTHRSWYVDQQDWVKAREAVDAIHDVSSKEESAQASKDSEGPKYILVPDSSSGINNVCPICQERFENKWFDTVQEWVWLDTVLVGNRAYHASCRAEATRDRESTPGLSRRTPEPVLGKRKAETGLTSPKIRVQKTFV